MRKMRLWTLRTRIIPLLLLLPFLSAVPLRAAEPVEVGLGFGEVEVIEDGPGHEIDLEVRFPRRTFHLLPRFLSPVTPLLGTIATTKGAVYAYAGLRADLPLVHH